MQAILSPRYLVSLVIFILASLVTIFLYQAGALHNFFSLIKPVYLLPEFLTGMLYTTFLTSPIAVVFLVLLSVDNDPLVIAIVGGLGSVFVDLFLLKIIRNFYKKVSRKIFGNSSNSEAKRITKTIKRSLGGVLNPVVIVLGSIIIASPLPDELGLAILGLSSLSSAKIVFISFAFNALGIYTISLIAKSLI